MLRQSFRSAGAIFISKNVRLSIPHIFTHFSYENRVRQTCLRYNCVSICEASFLHICDDFHYPGAGPPDMLISSLDFNDSRLRACIDVARCFRAMISNVSRACRVYGAEPETTGNHMVWRTHVSQISACVTFGARRRWRPASLLGSPAPSTSTNNTAKCAARCTHVSRISVCVAFGARGLAATPLGVLSCTPGPPNEPSGGHTQASKRVFVAQAAHYQDQPQSPTAPPKANNSHRCATPVKYAP